jgi:hypothetical protein
MAWRFCVDRSQSRNAQGYEVRQEKPLIPQFPHCDARILHEPGDCEYCDAHPEWQELRVVWGIAFTGHKPTGNTGYKQLPCPADYNRGDKHQGWGGNRPKYTLPKEWQELVDK